MNKKYTYLIMIFLIAASLAAFGRIAGNDFINYDDTEYITDNHHIKSGINLQTIQWAFSNVVMANWHPLTMLSHTLDWNLFGASASGHHLMSLLLHISTSIFLFFFLNKTTKNIWTSAFAAALFVLHPLRVESVAWASERKDVLSMFFGMATIYTYSFYAESSKLSKYFLCLTLFILSLLSKPMLVTLPFVMMLLDYWPLKRWDKAMAASIQYRYKLTGRLVWEKVPFFLVTISSSVVTFWAQNKAVVSMESIPFYSRIANAILAYMLYLGKIFWPHNMVIYYPYDLYHPLWKVLIFALILIVVTFIALYYMRKQPFLFTGWFWYLGTLVPVIGLVQVGGQAMADRYTYFPSIGISVILAWGTPLLLQKVGVRGKIVFLMAMAALCILAVSTWMQSGYWKNSIMLFNHALHLTKDNQIAHYNLGMALSAEGKIDDAINHYSEAIRINPNYSEAFNNRGNAYVKLRQYQKAIDDFNKAIEIRPDNAEAYNNYGSAYLLQGDKNLGCRYARKACAMGVCKAYNKAQGNKLCH